MKQGDKVYYIDVNTVKEAEVLKIAGGFVTLRFQYPDPNSAPGHVVYQNGGIRLRQNRVFETQQEAESAIRQRK